MRIFASATCTPKPYALHMLPSCLVAAAFPYAVRKTARVVFAGCTLAHHRLCVRVLPSSAHPQMVFFAARPIKKYEELTWDYECDAAAAHERSGAYS